MQGDLRCRRRGHETRAGAGPPGLGCRHDGALAKNKYDLDEASHIELDQDLARSTGTDKLLIRVCAAHVYSEAPDGTVLVQHAACLECGTCLAVAAPGTLKWHYPGGGFGVTYREG